MGPTRLARNDSDKSSGHCIDAPGEKLSVEARLSDHAAFDLEEFVGGYDFSGFKGFAGNDD
jgi:hypothetical protein